MTVTKKEGATAIQPYLFFGGRCDEALAFYKEVLGAEVEMLIRFNESPEPHPEGAIPPGFENKIMHVSFRIRGTTLNASDGPGVEGGFNAFALTLYMPSEAEAARVFALLSEGGKVTQPLTETFFSPCFGMLTDKFGLGWMLMVPPEV